MDNFRHAIIEDFKKAQRASVNQYTVTQEW